MADIDTELNALAGSSVSIDEELGLLEPGLSPENPLDERAQSVPPGLRFSIMTAGGGGTAGERMLQAEGIDAVHRGGMNYSVREPDGYWRVMDPSKLELADFTSDIMGDVGSIAAMTGGAVLGAPGGLPGMAAGAASGGAVAQGARTALGSLGGIEPTGGELAGDIAYEAAIGGGSELLGAAAAPVLRGIGKRVFPKRFTTEERTIRSAIPNQTTGEFRSHWDIADMPEPDVKRLFREGAEPDVPLHEGLVIPPKPGVDTHGSVVGYSYRDLQAKLAKEKYPEAAATIEKMAAGEGKSRVDMAVIWIDEMMEEAGTKTRRLYDNVNWGADEPELFANLTSIIAQGTMSGKQRREMVRQLAQTWGIETKGIKDRALTRQVLRRMSDGDFVYREAARKSGVAGAFSPEANLDDLMKQVYDIEVERWKRIQANRALEGAGQREVIEAGFEGGPMQQFAKEPPYSMQEHLRASELAPFIRGERYKIADREAAEQAVLAARAALKSDPLNPAAIRAVKESNEALERAMGLEKPDPFGRGGLERPQAAGDFDQMVAQMNRDRKGWGQPPLTEDEIAAFGRRRTKTDVRTEKLGQEADIVESEYKRRVYGEVPEMTPEMKLSGEIYEEPLVNLEARSRQIFERRAGVPWDKAKNRPKTATRPETPIEPTGFAPLEGFVPGKTGAAAGGPTGGVVPRAEAVKFWEFINLRKLTRLRVGGREIPLSAPQREVVNRTIHMMALSPGMKAKAKWINRLAGALQLPRTALDFTLRTMARGMGAQYRMGGMETARGGIGATAGFFAGGVPGAAAGFAAELAGRGAAAVGKRLMREPDENLLRELIAKAMSQEASKAAQLLQKAGQTLREYGKTAFRSMIYEAMHEPQVRKVFDLYAQTAGR